MSSEHAIDALTDDERRLMETIEADLDREMAVEPSADFAARVRARIRAADRGGAWTFPWALAAAAVLMVVTGILFASWRTTPAGKDSPAIATGHDVALPAPKPSAPIVAMTRPPDAKAARIPPTLAPNVPAAEPEVLIPPDFRLAIGRVMEMVRAGTLNERVFPASTPARTERAPGAPASTPARTERAPGTPADRAAAGVEESAEAVAPMVVEELQVLPIDVTGGGIEKGFGS